MTEPEQYDNALERHKAVINETMQKALNAAMADLAEEYKDSELTTHLALSLFQQGAQSMIRSITTISLQLEIDGDDFK